MRTMTDGRWLGILQGAAAALLLASCSGEKTPPAAAAPETAPTPVAAAPPSLPAETAPERPAGADTVDAALAGAQAFNAKALTDLAAIEKAERRVRDQASRALEAARRGDAARVTAARTDAEAAHKGLTDGLSGFRSAAAEQQAAVAAAMALCAPAAPGVGQTASPAIPPPPPVTTPMPGAPATAAPAGLAAYEGCTALAAEQALLTQNIEALANRYQAAETAYRQDRPKLEEAAATVALGRLGGL